MEHEFVFVDGVNINATHLLKLSPEQATKELLANDQVPGKDDGEKKAWVADALGKAKEELKKREENKKKQKEELKKQQDARVAAKEQEDKEVNLDDNNLKPGPTAPGK